MMLLDDATRRELRDERGDRAPIQMKPRSQLGPG